MFSFRDFVLFGKNVISKILRKKHVTSKSRMEVTTSTFMSNPIVKLSAVPKLKQFLQLDNGHY
jgi:hypothetical protein